MEVNYPQRAITIVRGDTYIHRIEFDDEVNRDAFTWLAQTRTATGSLRATFDTEYANGDLTLTIPADVTEDLDPAERLFWDSFTINDEFVATSYNHGSVVRHDQRTHPVRELNAVPGTDVQALADSLNSATWKWLRPVNVVLQARTNDDVRDFLIAADTGDLVDLTALVPSGTLAFSDYVIAEIHHRLTRHDWTASLVLNPTAASDWSLS